MQRRKSRFETIEETKSKQGARIGTDERYPRKNLPSLLLPPSSRQNSNEREPKPKRDRGPHAPRRVLLVRSRRRRTRGGRRRRREARRRSGRRGVARPERFDLKRLRRRVDLFLRVKRLFQKGHMRRARTVLGLIGSTSWIVYPVPTGKLDCVAEMLTIC